MAISSAKALGPGQEIPALWLRRMWERMVAMYGHAWTNVHGLTPHETNSTILSISGDTWSRALAGITSQQIGAGLEACVAEGGKFPPSVPRFRAMCLAIPKLAVVRAELQRGQFSPFSRAVWQELDTYRFKQATADQADRLLREAYDVIHDHFMRGEPLPDEPTAALEAQADKFTPATPEQVERHFAAIRTTLENDPR